MNTTATTKRVKSTEVQIGDLLHRGYRGVMRVATITVRDGWVCYYNSNGDLYLHKLNGWAKVIRTNNQGENK